MKDGFVCVAAATPHIRVADVAYNTQSCEAAIRQAADKGARIIVLPELCITGYTCEDLFLQDSLVRAAEQGIARIVQATKDLDALVVVGTPVRVASKLYNCAAVMAHGELLGIVPKQTIPTYSEFYEGRHFVAGTQAVTYISYAGASQLAFGAKQLFCCEEMDELKVAVELCEDVWAPLPPSVGHALAGATLICNLSASNELVGKEDYRRDLVCGQSARLVCGYVYADAGWGESTTDLVFAGHNLVCENGVVLHEAKPFTQELALSQIDMQLICAERQRLSSFSCAASAELSGYVSHSFSLSTSHTELTRRIDAFPFVPSDEQSRHERCEKIFTIQAQGLAKRLAHTQSKTAVVGLSGGLDSTLALLVTVRAFDMLGRDRSEITAVTMPGFGTTKRTRTNAEIVAEQLGVRLRTIDITQATRQHFQDIEHNEELQDTTYENAQARERTQILMDVANACGGLVIGTGDLSELALGWATYNGDHMSMYGVNAGVPKTLVRHLVRYVADTSNDDQLRRVLLDILDTPVSPELLPAQEDGAIAQRTEDLVGPYELHDFFLYHMLRHGCSPTKVLRLACYAFKDAPGGTAYDEATILSWLKVFYRRFFAQQFKRSCMPDGPKVGSVALSPRGDLRMPSDACATLWMSELDALGTHSTAKQ